MATWDALVSRNTHIYEITLYKAQAHIYKAQALQAATCTHMFIHQYIYIYKEKAQALQTASACAAQDKILHTNANGNGDASQSARNAFDATKPHNANNETDARPVNWRLSAPSASEDLALL